MAGARRAPGRRGRRLIGIAVTHRSARAQTQPRTLTVARGTVRQTVSASGTIEPATEADLSFQSAGTVNSVSVSVGQQVTQGEVLASIDTSAPANRAARLAPIDALRSE